MTVKGALKAKEAGAAAIVVSNHGGRVLDQCPATAEVLPEIVSALHGSDMDGPGGWRHPHRHRCVQGPGPGRGRRADRPALCHSVYGGGEEGVRLYIEKLAGELADAMQMLRRPHPGRHHPRNGPYLQVKHRP